jgi:hypothetical protein
MVLEVGIVRTPRIPIRSDERRHLPALPRHAHHAQRQIGVASAPRIGDPLRAAAAWIPGSVGSGIEVAVLVREQPDRVGMCNNTFARTVLPTFPPAGTTR